MGGVFPEHDEAVRLAVGPESITWRRAGDMRTMFGAGDFCHGLSHPDRTGPNRPGPKRFRT